MDHWDAEKGQMCRGNKSSIRRRKNNEKRKHENRNETEKPERTMIGFIGSVSKLPKYIAPAKSPSAELGMEAYWQNSDRIGQKNRKKKSED